MDELKKADGMYGVGPNAQNIIRDVGILLDAFRETQFGALVSTLDVEPVMMGKRRVDWVPLRFPTPDEVVTLFPTVNKSEKDLVRCFATLAGGHFRTLEYGWKIWDDQLNCIGSSIQPGWRHLKVDKITLDQLKQWGGLWQEDSPSQDVVTKALLGKSYDLMTKIGDRTFSGWIESGVCMQSIHNTNREYVPTLRMLQLYNGLSRHKQLKSLLEDCVPGERFKKKPFRKFERFHIYWEHLRRSLLEETEHKVTTFTQYYGLEPTDHTLDPDLDRLFCLTSKTMVHHLTSPFQPFIEKASVKLLLRGLFLGKGKNDPMDSFYLEELPGRQLLFVGIKCIYTKDSGNTTMTKQDMDDDVEGLMEFLFPNNASERRFGGGDEEYILLKEHVVMVFASFQRDVPEQSDRPPNVIVLNRHRLETLYSPTLMPLIDL